MAIEMKIINLTNRFEAIFREHPRDVGLLNIDDEGRYLSIGTHICYHAFVTSYIAGYEDGLRGEYSRKPTKKESFTFNYEQEAKNRNIQVSEYLFEKNAYGYPMDKSIATLTCYYSECIQKSYDQGHCKGFHEYEDNLGDENGNF